MNKVLIAVLFILAGNLSGLSQTCADSAREVTPQVPPATAKTYEASLMEAMGQEALTPNDPNAVIWVGRRTAYIGKYKDAIKVFTNGIAKFPEDARFYRHRGHRYITLRCFDDAIRDLEKAAKLIKGKVDEVEPDGLPNARNIPTSTLQTNIWYHLGLAYYLKGDFKKALKAYKECMKVSKNPDMLVATVHWLYMTERRMGNAKKSAKSLELIAGEPDIIENRDYYEMVKVYQGKSEAATLEKTLGGEANTLGNASLGYGLGNWHFYNGRHEEAITIFRKIVAGNQWASFGFIAAEAELRWRKP